MGIQADIAGLAELKLKAEAASEAMPGRWTVHRDGMGSEFPPHPDQNFGIDDSRGWAVVWHGIGRNGGIWHEEVAEFIAAVNPISVLALIAEVEALRKDAKRYRWFRDHSLQIVHASTGPWVHNLDKVIDEAMAAVDVFDTPLNCRQRMAASGRPYPRSSCYSCGQFAPKSRECDARILAANLKGEV